MGAPGDLTWNETDDLLNITIFFMSISLHASSTSLVFYCKVSK